MSRENWFYLALCTYLLTTWNNITFFAETDLRLYRKRMGHFAVCDGAGRLKTLWFDPGHSCRCHFFCYKTTSRVKKIARPGRQAAPQLTFTLLLPQHVTSSIISLSSFLRVDSSSTFLCQTRRVLPEAN